ncbi:MAG: zinc-binding dehydrogenase [Gemmatimonadetes bacterium]|nr:zinc-binding dehydrogenase [Gemmatimonadota bacterium]NIO31729.1 zinc-binding dehydrogenase [Gemmatimonadota bacterium]
MRAIVIREPGGPEVLEVQKIKAAEPGRREIRVRVYAAGVNRADLLQRRGHYPPPAGWPAEVPGLEYAGEVEAVGEAVELWKAGDRVMGLVGGGGYAEYVVVQEREALAIPPLLSFEEAAAVPEVFITAHDALFTQMRLELGERLLIHAVGSGVGTAALQLAKAAGATVIGTSRAEWKLERATDYGLDVLINTSEQNFPEMVEQATAGQGVHILLDLVGGPYLAGNIASLAEKGRMIVVGLTAGRTAEVDLGAILRKRLSIVGTSLRFRPLEEKIDAVRAFDHDVGSLLATGRVRPVLDRIFEFDDAAEAHRYMEADQNFGKLVIRIR